MSCCTPGAGPPPDRFANAAETGDTILAASTPVDEGVWQVEFAVPDIHCAACMVSIETALARNPAVKSARVNFSTRSVRVAYRPEAGDPMDMLAAIRRAGHSAFVLDPETRPEADTALRELVRAMAVAGFAAGNIMLLSVSVWSGADAATRDLFHFISGLIAVPAVAYAGQPFFRSAWRAVSHAGLNMDVPISLAVLLALALSLLETLNGGAHAYFDAAVGLLFFLLIGRTLDHLMREKARSAVRNLARLAPHQATRIGDDGSLEKVRIGEIEPGNRLRVLAGERIPVDAQVTSGASDLDLSLVNGESVPVAASKGSRVLAGTMNLTGVLELEATSLAANSFLARMVEMMAAAEGSHSRARRLADRAAAVYAPAVHLGALVTFLGWGILAGDWHAATLNAVAVLIVTCPCALALAVPIVHAVAAGYLFERGIMLRDGAALERLALATDVAFDKTGTLTEGRPRFAGQVYGDPEHREKAASMASASTHPLSQALAALGTSTAATNLVERPGCGLEMTDGSGTWRLGSADFCNASSVAVDGGASLVWLAHEGEPVAAFAFEDAPRPEAEQVVAGLRSAGYGLHLLSGDRPAPVSQLAEQLGIVNFHAGMTPEDKLDAVADMRESLCQVLMVGDGLNDAPALRAADISMAPSSATDIGRNAADLVYTGNHLSAVPVALGVARRAARIVKQNFGLALAYNVIAVPLAVTGQVTPLIAALAMSSSSILVTLNALRLRLTKTLSTGAAERHVGEAPTYLPVTVQ